MWQKGRLAKGSEPEEERPYSTWFRAWSLLWEHPISSALLALGIYIALALGRGPLWPVSSQGYYNYLADAFLHGQVHLQVIPPSVHDLSLFQGQYFLYWGPFPAVLLMPFVALWGVLFSDIVFTAVVGALNVGLTAFLLRQANRQRMINLSEEQCGLLVLFFALGTVHTTLAPNGRVWFTGHTVAYLCTVLAYLAAISLKGRLAFALTGLAITGAMLTRNHLALVGLWPAVYLLYRHRSLGWRRLVGYALIGGVSVVLAVSLLGAYNWARFGSVFDNGLAHHAMAHIFVDDYQKYGAFHPYYLKRNLFYQYIAYPFLPGADALQGGSLFLLSPVFFAAFWGLAVGRPRWSVGTLGATILLVNIPILFLMGTGWIQFGPRYTLDFTVPLLLLTALGVSRWPTWVLAMLTLVSIVHYLVGTLVFLV